MLENVNTFIFFFFFLRIVSYVQDLRKNNLNTAGLNDDKKLC
jgi:hypothetical protein